MRLRFLSGCFNSFSFKKKKSLFCLMPYCDVAILISFQTKPKRALVKFEVVVFRAPCAPVLHSLSNALLKRSCISRQSK